MRKKVELVAIRYHDKVSGFFVAVGLDGDTYVGVSDLVPVGTEITVEGEFKFHEKYGERFVVDQIVLEDSQQAMALLLASGFLKGIKESKARALTAHLGDAVFDALDACVDIGPEDPLCQSFYRTKGVGPVTGSQIIGSWKEQRHWAKDALAGISAGLTVKESRRAAEYFGHGALTKIVNEEPYRLIAVPRVSWDTVDRVGREYAGFRPDAPQRVAAAIAKALTDICSRQGHTYLPSEVVAPEVAKLVPEVMDPFGVAASSLETVGVIPYNGGWTTQNMYEKAREIAQEARRIRDASSEVYKIEDDELNSLVEFELEDKQKEAVREALRNPFLIITGGAGTGKTTVVKAIIRAFTNRKKFTSQGCPTGKAAVRLSQSTGVSATTLHSLLGIFNPIAPHTVDTHVFVVDESSMLNNDLMWWVVKAVKSGSRLILVGDDQQLEPIGAGKPFSDMIACGKFPHVHLDVIQRQGENSGIVREAAKVARGLKPSYGGDKWSDFKLFHVATNSAIGDQLIEYVRKVMDKYNFTLDDIMLMSPVKRGNHGTITINTRMQEIYNPGPFPLKGVPFKNRDRVMQVSNWHDEGVMNGEVGKISWIADNELEKRLIEAEDDPDILVVDFDDPQRRVGYSREEAGAYLDLGYCFTAHKAQGSEAKCVVMGVPVVGNFVNRKMVYTMITRAKEYVLIFAANGAMSVAVRQSGSDKRFTMLGDLL